ncbi:MAG: hypothetical protein AAF378_25610 [Cyanobacteria bacterium P01_A01_bin.84]
MVKKRIVRYDFAERVALIVEKTEQLINEVTDSDKISQDCKAAIYNLVENCLYPNHTYDVYKCDEDELLEQIRQLIKDGGE